MQEVHCSARRRAGSDNDRARLAQLVGNLLCSQGLISNQQDPDIAELRTPLQASLLTFNRNALKVSWHSTRNRPLGFRQNSATLRKFSTMWQPRPRPTTDAHTTNT